MTDEEPDKCCRPEKYKHKPAYAICATCRLSWLEKISPEF